MTNLLTNQLYYKVQTTTIFTYFFFSQYVIYKFRVQSHFREVNQIRTLSITRPIPLLAGIRFCQKEQTHSSGPTNARNKSASWSVTNRCRCILRGLSDVHTARNVQHIVRKVSVYREEKIRCPKPSYGARHIFLSFSPPQQGHTHTHTYSNHARHKIFISQSCRPWKKEKVENCFSAFISLDYLQKQIPALKR